MDDFAEGLPKESPVTFAQIAQGIVDTARSAEDTDVANEVLLSPAIIAKLLYLQTKNGELHIQLMNYLLSEREGNKGDLRSLFNVIVDIQKVTANLVRRTSLQLVRAEDDERDLPQGPTA